MTENRFRQEQITLYFCQYKECRASYWPVDFSMWVVLYGQRDEIINNNYDNDGNIYQPISDLSVYVYYFPWSYIQDINWKLTCVEVKHYFEYS